MTPDRVRQLIESGLPGARVEVGGDERHFDAVVVAGQVDGLARAAPHRLVYAALGEHFDGEVLHALTLRTYTPALWERLEQTSGIHWTS